MGSTHRSCRASTCGVQTPDCLGNEFPVQLAFNSLTTLMLTVKQKIETPAEDFVFYPCNGGVKIAPSTVNDIQPPRFSDLMNLSMDVCLISRKSAALYMNDPAVHRSGMLSLKECIGKTIFDVAQSETAYYITEHQQKTLKDKSLRIIEYEFLRKDDFVHRCLLFSLPWYQSNNQLGGILDLAIVTERDSIPHSIGQLHKLGLLNQSHHSPPIHDEALSKLSKRERECVKLLSEGMKSKQIAKSLQLSPRTVDHYLESCMIKFSVTTRYELISKYMSILSRMGHRPSIG